MAIVDIYWPYFIYILKYQLNTDYIFRPCTLADILERFKAVTYKLVACAQSKEILKLFKVQNISLILSKAFRMSVLFRLMSFENRS